MMSFHFWLREHHLTTLCWNQINHRPESREESELLKVGTETEDRDVMLILLHLLLQVRGAPAIAIVGCLSLAVELRAGAGGEDPVTFIRESLCHLTSARPTAVNMGRAARELMEFAENESMEKNSEQLRERCGLLTFLVSLCLFVDVSLTRIDLRTFLDRLLKVPSFSPITCSPL